MNTTPNTPSKMQAKAEMIKVDTKEYRSNHGAEPRGRGNWFFAFDGREDHDELYACNDTFSAAKARAQKEAKRRGAQRIKVMS